MSDKSFRLDPVPPPAMNDAATAATFTLVDGQRDGNGGELGVLHDGRVPSHADEPAKNFLFRNGGRFEIDLGKPTSIQRVHSYSWHPRARAPQIYKLYAATGDEKGFKSAPPHDSNPASYGWMPIAKVDTRGKGSGGQHAVSISGDRGAALGEFRYLLFDIKSPDSRNPAGGAFFSEIDVIETNGPSPVVVPERIVKTYQSSGGGFNYRVDVTVAPDLVEWVEDDLVPSIRKWYPKLVDMLPSDGYRAPDSVEFEFRDDMGGTPAYALANKV